MSFFIECDEAENIQVGLVESALEGCVETDATLVIELSLVDEDEIQRLNKELRKIDRVTDVLSFPALDIVAGQAVKKAEHPFEQDEEGRILLGSVAICTQRAKEQAQEYGHSFERELHYLLVHGIMHCLGYDHEDEQDKILMREKEESVLRKMNITRE